MSWLTFRLLCSRQRLNVSPICSTWPAQWPSRAAQSRHETTHLSAESPQLFACSLDTSLPHTSPTPQRTPMTGCMRGMVGERVKNSYRDDYYPPPVLEEAVRDLPHRAHGDQSDSLFGGDSRTSALTDDPSPAQVGERRDRASRRGALNITMIRALHVILLSHRAVWRTAPTEGASSSILQARSGE